MNKTYTLQKLPQIAKELIETVSNKTLLFYGDMGIGKTTLIKELIKQLELLNNHRHKEKRNGKILMFLNKQKAWMKNSARPAEK